MQNGTDEDAEDNGIYGKKKKFFDFLISYFCISIKLVKLILSMMLYDFLNLILSHHQKFAQ
jgi:hypothetical protein